MWVLTFIVQDVCSGSSGHTEAVQMIFDPNVVSYKEQHSLQILLQLTRLDMQMLGLELDWNTDS